MATGALRFVELPFLLSASPLAAYIYDTTGNYQMAFLNPGRSDRRGLHWPAIYCLWRR